MAKKKVKKAKKVFKAESAVEKMIEVLDETMEDASKFDSGVMSPGSRVRKAMQTIKVMAQDLRVNIQEVKNSKK